MEAFRHEELEFRPVTLKQWPDLQELFGPNGADSGCWCMWWRQTREQLVRRISSFELASEIGPLRGHVYATPFDRVQHFAFVYGELGQGQDNGFLVRRFIKKRL